MRSAAQAVIARGDLAPAPVVEPTSAAREERVNRPLPAQAAAG